MTALRPLAALLAGGLILAGTAQVPAFAQTTVTRSKTVAPGKTVRLEIAPNLKKDCSPGPMPEFKVSGAPKNGSVITKVGKLKTPASYRCPNKEAAVQALFYQPNTGFTG
ncbi:MAG: 4-aminobutyrate aminotransferase, partial [Methylobacterium sp.]